MPIISSSRTARPFSRLTFAISVLMAVTVLVLVAASAASAAPNALFASHDSGTTLSQFTFGSGGELVSNGTATSDVGSGFEAITPNGKYLYVPSYLNDAVDEFSIGSDGKLTPLSPASVATSSDVLTVAVSPDGHNLYVGSEIGGSAGSVYVFDIGSDGVLTLAQTVSSGLESPAGIAVSPSGASVYVADGVNNEIFEYDRASNGQLAPKPTPTVAAPAATGSLSSLVMTPNGGSLYVSSATLGSPGAIGEYTVGTGGELSPKSVPTTPVTDGAFSLTVSPNGRYLYAPTCNPASLGRGAGSAPIYEYGIGTDGELAPLAPPSVTGTSACIAQVWLTAAGTSAYATDAFANQVDEFDVAADGQLSPKPTPSISTGSNSEPVGVVIPPDQSPVAAFTDTAAMTGAATRFDGSGSSAPSGTIAKYAWNFGDGATLANGGATPSHTYPKAGTYKVTLTVTDDSGCSTTFVFTGQTAYCSGGPAATVTHTVVIKAKPTPKPKPKPKPKATSLTVTPHSAKAGKRTCFRFHLTSGASGVKGATLRFASRTGHTNSSGRATLCLTLKQGVYNARATKSGFKAASASVRIRPAARKHPPFTG